jgi:hypothetical protein
MNETAREFIKIAYAAMQKAYQHESKGMTECETETAKKVGEVLQAVGDLSRLA